MRLNDQVSRLIQEYPGIFKDTDYEKSRMRVLVNMFFVSGNGMRQAHTFIPSDGGYLKEDDGYDYDKPYGEDTYRPLPEGYFDSIVYTLQSFGQPLDVTTNSTGRIHYFRYDKKNLLGIPPVLMVQEAERELKPPKIGEIHWLLNTDVFLQDDWKTGLISACEWMISYYDDQCNNIVKSAKDYQKLLLYKIIEKYSS